MAENNNVKNEDVKPDVSQQGAGETISFRVKDSVRHHRVHSIHLVGMNSLRIFVYLQNGEETTFKVKKHTKMSKVLDAYAGKKGLNREAIRFMLDGARVDPNDTPASLELEQDDQIDCHLEQQGGASM